MTKKNCLEKGYSSL